MAKRDEGNRESSIRIDIRIARRRITYSCNSQKNILSSGVRHACADSPPPPPPSDLARAKFQNTILPADNEEFCENN